MSPFTTGGVSSTATKRHDSAPTGTHLSATGASVREPARTISEVVWYTIPEVAALLKYGLNKTKKLVHEKEIRSVKDGKYRRILPEWVDEYVRSLPEDA
jgi:excisionase family DNA binding protein